MRLLRPCRCADISRKEAFPQLRRLCAAPQAGDIRDRLIAKIEHIEADDGGDLAARVRMFVDAKQELEQRVSTVTEQFSKLATIRNDIAGLFDKLSSPADTSSN